MRTNETRGNCFFIMAPREEEEEEEEEGGAAEDAAAAGAAAAGESASCLRASSTSSQPAAPSRNMWQTTQRAGPVGLGPERLLSSSSSSSSSSLAVAAGAKTASSGSTPAEALVTFDTYSSFEIVATCPRFPTAAAFSSFSRSSANRFSRYSSKKRSSSNSPSRSSTASAPPLPLPLPPTSAASPLGSSRFADQAAGFQTFSAGAMFPILRWMSSHCVVWPSGRS